MSTWTTVTSTAITQGFNPAERSALERAEGDAEALASVTAQATAELVAEVRMMVASGGRCKVEADDTLIPLGLLAATTAILRYTLLTRYAITIAEHRKTAMEDARALLDRVSKGELNLDTESDSTPKPYFKGRKSKAATVHRHGIM